MDFDLSDRQRHFRDRVRAFIDENIRPRCGDFASQHQSGDQWEPIQLIEELKPKARTAGLWNLFMPPAPAIPSPAAALTRADSHPCMEETWLACMSRVAFPRLFLRCCF